MNNYILVPDYIQVGNFHEDQVDVLENVTFKRQQQEAFPFLVKKNLAGNEEGFIDVGNF